MANKDLRLKKIVLDSNRLCNFLYPSCVLFIQTEVVLLYSVSLCLIPPKHNLQMSDRVCARFIDNRERYPCYHNKKFPNLFFTEIY
jgi:hypothetical protein